jgi:hypothetical protein
VLAALVKGYQCDQRKIVINTRFRLSAPSPSEHLLPAVGSLSLKEGDLGRLI